MEFNHLVYLSHMQSRNTYYQIVVPILGFFLGCYFVISSAFAYEHTETPIFSANYAQSAPILNPVANLVINPYHLNREFNEDDGFTISQLLNHIERLHSGRQFNTVSSSFGLQNSNFGIAILSIDTPTFVTPLVSIGGSGNSFRYPISTPRYADLARLFEPHQKISFRNNSLDDVYEVKIRFRLWDLRERNQITPFQEYRIDKTGGVSAFSNGIQEVTFKVSQYDKRTKPYWSTKSKVIQNYSVQGRTILLNIDDLLRDPYGELKLKDKDNDPLGLLIHSANNSDVTIYYRYHDQLTWNELQENSSVYLPLAGQLYISNSSTDFHGMKFSFPITGWDGDSRYQKYSKTDDQKAIDIIFNHELIVQ